MTKSTTVCQRWETLSSYKNVGNIHINCLCKPPLLRVCIKIVHMSAPTCVSFQQSGVMELWCSNVYQNEEHGGSDRCLIWTGWHISKLCICLLLHVSLFSNLGSWNCDVAMSTKMRNMLVRTDALVLIPWIWNDRYWFIVIHALVTYYDNINYMLAWGRGQRCKWC